MTAGLEPLTQDQPVLRQRILKGQCVVLFKETRTTCDCELDVWKKTLQFEGRLGSHTSDELDGLVIEELRVTLPLGAGREAVLECQSCQHLGSAHHTSLLAPRSFTMMMMSSLSFDAPDGTSLPQHYAIMNHLRDLCCGSSPRALCPVGHHHSGFFPAARVGEAPRRYSFFSDPHPKTQARNLALQLAFGHRIEAFYETTTTTLTLHANRPITQKPNYLFDFASGYPVDTLKIGNAVPIIMQAVLDYCDKAEVDEEALSALNAAMGLFYDSFNAPSVHMRLIALFVILEHVDGVGSLCEHRLVDIGVPCEKQALQLVKLRNLVIHFHHDSSAGKTNRRSPPNFFKQWRGSYAKLIEIAPEWRTHDGRPDLALVEWVTHCVIRVVFSRLGIEGVQPRETSVPRAYEQPR